MKTILLTAIALSGLVCNAQTPADTTTVENADTTAWNIKLDGVTVKAQRQLLKQEADRITYDVQADADSKTNTVMDMLRKIPMVMVDGEDKILVKGNQNYRIHKNGVHPTFRVMRQSCSAKSLSVKYLSSLKP